MKGAKLRCTALKHTGLEEGLLLDYSEWMETRSLVQRKQVTGR